MHKHGHRVAISGKDDWLAPESDFVHDGAQVLTCFGTVESFHNFPFVQQFLHETALGVKESAASAKRRWIAWAYFLGVPGGVAVVTEAVREETRAVLGMIDASGMEPDLKSTIRRIVLRAEEGTIIPLRAPGTS